MDDKQATDKYWGIINSGGAGLKNMPPEELQALIARLESVEGEGSKYAATLREMSSSNKMLDLSSQLTDFQSPLYQQYASYLQKTTPGIGVNSMLGTLMAGGTGYAGGQAIAQQRSAGMAGQRQDKINQGVQGFSLGNIGTGASLLGQQGQLGLGYAELSEERRQYDDQNAWYNKAANVVGSVVGLLNPLNLINEFSGGGSQGSGVNGAGQNGGQFNGNVKVGGYGNQQDLNYFG